MFAKTTALLLVLILACLSAHAQQTTPAFDFVPQVWRGANIGGYVFDSNTKVDAIALSDAGGVAFTAHRQNEGNGRDQTAVLTKERLVAREGQTVDGKILVRIATAVVAINNVGQVAYEALYTDSPHGKLHGGIFVDNHFSTEFEPSATGAASEFLIADDGMVRLRDGIMGPKGKKPWATNGLYQTAHRLERTLLGKIAPHGIYSEIYGESVDVADTVAWDKVTQQPQPKRSQAAPPKEARSCPAPAFPFPGEWALGADNGGPVAAHLFEQGSASRSYESPFYGHITAPFRQIQFSKECRPLVVAIGDTSTQQRFEIHAPTGLLTYRKPDGAFAFPGFFQKVTSPSFLQSDASWQINRQGHIVLRVTTDGGFAVLLARPLTADK